MIEQNISIHQAAFEPIETLDELNKFLSSLGTLPESARLGVLTDMNGQNQVLVILEPNFKVSLRLNLPINEKRRALLKLGAVTGIELRHLQGKQLTTNDINTLENLVGVWNQCEGQSTVLAIDELEAFLLRLVDGRNETGRGKGFTKPTLDRVAQDSHGYCMFEGCGENLVVDDLTGYLGNYGYNAHNVASSESGPRGIPYLSALLSDEPNNVLMLCDKHHRLIDKIATVDFNASRLTKMREEFTRSVTRLLEGLSFRPVPVFSILWPIGGHVASEPDERDIANCLSHIKARIAGTLNVLSSNDKSYRRKPESFLNDMNEVVEHEALSIIQQTQKASHKAALFAFGPMPALVGLGACLGNKCEITPMLRYRDGNCWMWPQKRKIDKPYEIKWDGDQLSGTQEATLCIGMTNYTDSMRRQELKLGLPTIKVLAKQMGNAAIPHPHNGLELKADLHTLMQTLFDKYAIQRLHVLICASNAVCVFLGQAFDLYQPDLLVYDFSGDEMEPRLLISYKKTKVELSVPKSV
ncbi:SAVED domain-containing protein [Rheinheimera mangrovi]|uniref:SAVED domain-containing protein n=1 Tax=Rheinheimera mangrovi TaxID=2498451 RepID=UPI000F8EDB7E|nr:SAVED domain-containing protein [Rheinheimera mangrovi]